MELWQAKIEVTKMKAAHPELRVEICGNDQTGHCVKGWDRNELILKVDQFTPPNPELIRPLQPTATSGDGLQPALAALVEVPLNEALMLVGKATRGTDFEAESAQVGFNYGWDLGPISTQETDRQMRAVRIALQFLGATAACWCLPSLETLWRNIKLGREARVKEFMAFSEQDEREGFTSENC